MVYPHIMDQRLLAKRRKTVLELKPDYFWDAAYGCTQTNGSACTDGINVMSWAPVRGGVTLLQTDTLAKRPTWLEYGISRRPALLFNGSNWMTVGSGPMAAATSYTIAICYEMLGEEPDPAVQQTFIMACREVDSATNYFQISMRATFVPLTYTRANGAAAAGAGGSTDINDGNPHVGIWTVNAAGNAWVMSTDGVDELEEAVGTGNSGLSFEDVPGINRFTVGGFSGNGTTISAGLYSKIAYIAMWDQRL